MSVRGPAVTALAALVALLAGATHAHAQAPPDGPTDRADAAVEPFLPASHWSRGALRRLAGAGLIDVAAAVRSWPVRRSRVRALLAGAEAEAGRRGGAAPVDLARGYADRFEREFPPPSRGRAVAPLARFGVGWSAVDGALRGGESVWVDGVGWVYPGPRLAADASAAIAAATVDAVVGDRVAVAAAVRYADGRVTVSRAYASAAVGAVDVWAGRRGLDLGAARGDGVVLSQGTTFDGAGIGTARGVRLPGPLSALGPVRGTFFVARFERSGSYRHPWFAAARVGIAPHPSLAIGFNRAALFGGAGNEPVTTRRVLLMAIGLTDVAGKDSDFENQVASIDVTWRARLAGVPVVFYGEWGFDDVGFAWTNVPGLIGGVELPAVPGLPMLSLAAEHVRFAGSCCGNPPWYRHGALAEGWTDRGIPLGHPLGGHGRQSSVLARLSPPRAPLLAGVRAFVRDRGEENLFAPDRAGRSYGAELELVAHGAAGLRVRATAALERGLAGWSTWSAAVGADVVLGDRRTP